MIKRLNLKSVVTLFVSSMLTFSTSIAVFATEMSLIMNGTLIPLTVEPITDNGNTLVGMREIFELLGVEVSWEEKLGQVIAVKEDKNIVLTIGSKIARVNGEYFMLSAKPRIVNGNTLVPLRFIGEILDYDVSWDPNNKVVSLSKQDIQNEVEKNDEEDYKKDYEKDLTVEEALEKAVANNSTLKTLSDSLELINKNRKDLISDMTVSDRYSETGVAQIYDTASTAMLLSLIEMDTKRDNAPLTKTILTTATEMGIRNIFTTIKNYQLDLGLLKQKIALDEINIKNLELKLSLGMESKINIDKAKLELDQNYETVRMIEKSIESEFVGLNNLMGNKTVTINLDKDVQICTAV